jgi:hypothetical protein
MDEATLREYILRTCPGATVEGPSSAVTRPSELNPVEHGNAHPSQRGG